MKKAVNALIIKDKRLLLFRKNLTWILPGGKPEEGESDIGALVREFKEEASGAEIKMGGYYKIFIGITPNKKDSLEAVTYFAELKKPGLRIVPSEEINEARFVGYPDTLFLYLSTITKKIIRQLIDDKYL